MKRLNLFNIDLNLLVAFDALVIEGSVSRAANRIGVSQPAMSRSLGQLRELFGDTLFRRTSNGMVPTPRAIELARTIRPNLENIAAAIGQRIAFDPAKAVRRFVLAMPDLAARLALPPVMRVLDKIAPGIDLTVLESGNHVSLAKVDIGQAELGLGVYEYLPPTVRSRNLRPLREVCVVDRDNAKLRGREMDLDTFLSLGHVVVSMHGDVGTPIDTVLETLGLHRRIAVSTPYFDCVPAFVQGTNFVAVVVEDLLDASAERQVLDRHPVPVPLEPIMSKMIWHARSDDDPGHTWLRDLFAPPTKDMRKSHFGDIEI